MCGGDAVATLRALGWGRRFPTLGALGWCARWAGLVAAYDGGYAVVGMSTFDGTSMDTIWSSPDGTNWTKPSLTPEEPSGGT